MINLNYLSRIELHCATETMVANHVREFHTTTNWVRRSHLGFNLSYINPLYNNNIAELSQGEVCLSLAPPYHIHYQSLSEFPIRHKSVRHFIDKAIPFLKIEKLLKESFSLNHKTKTMPYPSAGGLYSIKILLLILSDQVIVPNSISSKIYYFNNVKSTLSPLSNPSYSSINNILLDNIDDQSDEIQIIKPAIAIAYILYLDAAIVKYRERGYRFAMIEAGAMAHQADLVASKLELGSCLFGGFGDNELAAICRLNPAIMFPLIVQFFGVPDNRDHHAF